MKITIIAVGKLKESYLKEGIAEYAKRMPPYADLDIIEIAEEKAGPNPSPADGERIKIGEGRRILAALPRDAHAIVLDISGQNLSSTALAGHIEKVALGGISHIAFIIGGSIGLAPEIIKRGDFSLSFGKMTYPHQLMRLILLEQIYRAFKINRGETYHK